MWMQHKTDCFMFFFSLEVITSNSRPYSICRCVYGRCAGHSCFVPYLVEVICMKIMSLTEKKEDAVSPVIGVMLMLVVTIVIAAVVAAFAGGLGSDVEMAPTAVLDIDAHANGKLKVTSLSGETLTTKEITIKVTDASGNSKGTGSLYSEDGTKGYKEIYFSPGTTTVVTLDDSVTLPKGNYVTVTVVANGKHTVTTKEVLVKAEL